jgi:hypothetical protein
MLAQPGRLALLKIFHIAAIMTTATIKPMAPPIRPPAPPPAEIP